MNEQNDNAVIKKLKFEQAIENLEDMIERIESGEAGLEGSLKCYEQGTVLIKHCSGILDAAEKKISELTVDSTGGLQSDDK